MSVMRRWMRRAETYSPRGYDAQTMRIREFPELCASLRINAVGKECEEQEDQVQDRCQEWPCTSYPGSRFRVTCMQQEKSDGKVEKRPRQVTCVLFEIWVLRAAAARWRRVGAQRVRLLTARRGGSLEKSHRSRPPSCSPFS
ncbi:hypothetical protein L1887_61056 [Cichorium endivia]|nr:hypothetical protein L1887_61056 [Cichorium endivia]